ncbi:hypothetical protein HZH68_010212 [Vespula germanica]|uniref:Uncharacterized protein n=1 Tax=Vespula germanica TaxID=30212 RepID=A0A834N3Y5_VESGE|nr:hypothetical protein HZH68_010212 [Vespula germanica]
MKAKGKKKELGKILKRKRSKTFGSVASHVAFLVPRRRIAEAASEGFVVVVGGIRSKGRVGEGKKRIPELPDTFSVDGKYLRSRSVATSRGVKQRQEEATGFHGGTRSTLWSRCLSGETQETSIFAINVGSTKTLLYSPNFKSKAHTDIFCYYRNDIDGTSSAIGQEINK